MKISIDRTRFQSAVNMVKDVAFGQLPIMQNVKMEAGDGVVKLTATNGDQVVSVDAECQVSEKGSVTVPAKLIGQMVGALATQTVEFTHEVASSMAVLTGGDVTYKIATMSADKFPKEEAVKGIKIAFTKEELKDILRKTAYSASADTTRRVLCGVVLQTEDGGSVVSVATDGRRLSEVRLAKDAKGGIEAVIPTVGVKFLQRIVGDGEGEVKATFGSGSVRFSSDGWVFQTRIVDAKYPDWKQVVRNDPPNRVSIDRALLSEAVRQVSLSSPSSNTNIEVVFKNGAMTLTASSLLVSDARAMLPVKYDGDEVKICLNPQYVLDVLGSTDDDEVSFNFTSGTKPVTITYASADAVAVIMPMRIN